MNSHDDSQSLSNPFPNPNAPVVLVTGAARRIGAAIVRHFHAQGFRVVIHCRNSVADADALAAACNQQRPASAVVLQHQLSSAENARALAENALAVWQRIDVLVNNASAFFPTPIGTITEDNWADLMNSNAKIPLFLSQALTPALRATHGSIINLSDIHAEAGLNEHAPYVMAKAALSAMTHSLARELAPEIRVNAVAPGAILWPSSDNDITAEAQQAILNGIPMSTLGHPDDIAATVYFLAVHASYVTGEIIRVDGGRRLTG
jgi:pteridine reductase